MTSQTWGVIKQNPYMLLFPVTAGVVGLVAVLSVAGLGLGILGVTGAGEAFLASADQGDQGGAAVIVGIVVLVIAAYLGTLSTAVCMAGLVACADSELQGRDSSFGAGLAEAFRHLPALLGWAGIQTLVGWLLSAIRGDGSSGNLLFEILRGVAAGLLQVAWSVVSFFVLPLIVLRGRGPIEAIKESFALIRSTWGMQVAGNLRLGFLVVLLGVLPGIVAMVGGVFLMIADKAALGVPLAALGVIVVLLAQVLISALRAVFSVALFHYAAEGRALGPYGAGELRSAVRVRG